MTDANGLVKTRTLTLGDLGHTESQDFGKVSIDNTGTGYTWVTTNNTVVSADSLKDTLKFVAGNNIQLAADATNDAIRISSTYAHPNHSLSLSNGVETTLADITLIDSLTTNSTGHLTGATWRKLVAGSNITISPTANGNITIAGIGNTYPTTFAWTDGTTEGPTGSLTGTSPDVSFPAIPEATDERSGVVTTGTQTFGGNKTFSDGIKTSIIQPIDVTTGLVIGTENSTTEIKGNLKIQGDDLTISGTTIYEHVKANTISGIDDEELVITGNLTGNAATATKLNSNGEAGQFWGHNNTWITPVDTEYTAGTGLTLTGTTFAANLIDSTLRSVTAESITTTASRTYAVMPDADGDLIVNVPWKNT